MATPSPLIHRIVRYLDEHHTAFAVSRLILLSGVPVRRFHAESIEEDATVQRVKAALRQILSADEARRLEQFLGPG
ncbi:MAG: hypothetical protein EOO75_19730 [Myxococcales bacterium]|nr:MAG: hypothetical protein EOO75_19730 [Myxococcales bacterium]